MPEINAFASCPYCNCAKMVTNDGSVFRDSSEEEVVRLARVGRPEDAVLLLASNHAGDTVELGVQWG